MSQRPESEDDYPEQHRRKEISVDMLIPTGTIITNGTNDMRHARIHGTLAERPADGERMIAMDTISLSKRTR